MIVCICNLCETKIEGEIHLVRSKNLYCDECWRYRQEDIESIEGEKPSEDNHSE